MSNLDSAIFPKCPPNRKGWPWTEETSPSLYEIDVSFPKISIVTPSFNQGEYIEETIRSILLQNYPNLEYIIIDGGSTDNTVEIIKKYSKYLTYWVSEKDAGQSDAINKGIQKTTGQLFNWLNSDDYLEKNALVEIAKAYQENETKKVFCFGLSHLSNGEIIPFTKFTDPSNELKCYCDPIIIQPATFFSLDKDRSLVELSKALHYTMDYELWLRFMFLFGKESIFVSPEKVAVFRLHDESKTKSGRVHFINDIASILHSLLLKNKRNRLAELFESRFVISSNYSSSIQVPESKLGILDRMAVYFLLKWCRVIHNEKDFCFAKRMIREIDFSKHKLDTTEKEWLKLLRKDSRGNWFLLRLRRKIKRMRKGEK